MTDQAPTNDIVPSGFFVLRTPLLPFDELLTWGEDLEAASAGEDPVELETALAADRVRLRQRLRQVYARPEVREALFVASPDLEERLELWSRDPESEQGQKIERALTRYFARMAGRVTPFGLFAGCSVGTLGDQSKLALAGRPRYQRHTRFDMDYLFVLTDALAQQSDLRPALAFGVNTSLHSVRGRLRYLEVRRNSTGWTHHQVALEGTDYLEAVLARAREGGSLEALAAELLQVDPDAPQDADECIRELIDNQVLVSELRPAVTGPEPIEGLVARLQHRGEGYADRLEQARQEIEAIDAVGLGVEPVRYRHIARLLESLPGEVNLARLFQVDLVKPVEVACLGPAVLAEILRDVTLLHRLARVPREDRLARFRVAFVARYEGREVPLVEALDPDTGFGFGPSTGAVADTTALLDGVVFPEVAAQTVPWGRREALLLRKLGEALASDAAEVALDSRDLEEMAEPIPPLPGAFDVFATVAAASEEALAAGDFRVLLEGVSGPSGARLLGRFCHADPELHRHVQQHIRAEEALQPDAVFAEIVHLPEGRLGNVLARPVLRDYEIPCLGRASVPAERQIPVTDLRVSVAQGRIVLRSERLGRRVIPRLTSAHDYRLSQAPYGFLCALQGQGTAGALDWDWGPLGEAPFLPRVVSGRLVLCRARWRAGQDELKPLGQARGAARFRAVQKWRAARRLPRWVAVADGDNELPLDLDNVLAVDALVELLKGRERATLVELFPGPDQLWACGPEGRFMHQLVIPFVRTPVPTGGSPVVLPVRQASRPSLRTERTEPRTFPPGSEWLYAKLYTGPASLDQVLRDVVGTVVETALRSGAADHWFFVRYGDPDWHLRLRWHGEPGRLHACVLPALQVAVAPLLEDGRVWRFQLDTYEREVERYGGPEGVVLAERLFHADSEAALALVSLLAEDARDDIRWRLALVGMHLLLTDLGLDLDCRRAILRSAREALAVELHVDAKVRHQLGARFRKERRALESLLDPACGADGLLVPHLETLRRRSARLAPVMAELKACAQSGRLSTPLSELAVSYLHMHANRLLRSAHRAQELVLYDFLGRLYDSQAARTAER